MGRRLLRDVVKGFHDHDLLTYASAIAFQVLTSLIPLAMCGLAVLGILDLKEAWTQHLAPQVAQNTSSDWYHVINSVVQKATNGQRAFWLIAGIPLVIWETSGAVRAVMGALCRIYQTGEDRSRTRRFLVSFALGLSSSALLLISAAIIRFTPNVTSGALFSILRWPVAFVLLITLVWSLLHYAPAHPVPAHWASFGSVVCVVLWLVASIGYGFYVSDIAHYQSIFGTLTALFVSFFYLYLSAIAFLLGAQLDAMVRRERTGSWSGFVSARRSRRREGVATPRPVR